MAEIPLQTIVVDCRDWAAVRGSRVLEICGCSGTELGKIILGNRGYDELARSLVCCGRQELCGARERLSVGEDDARRC